MDRPEALGPGGITNFDGHVGYFLFVCGIGYIIAQRVGAITYNRECSSAGNGQSNFPGPCFKWIKNADVVVINPCKFKRIPVIKVFELSEGGEIVIGGTSDMMARASRKRVVLPYKARTENIRHYRYKEYRANVRIVELNDRYGIIIDEDFDYIVISPETYNVAVKINELRKERGKQPIKIVKVEHMKAADGKIISSTRIKAGERDKYGTLLAYNGK